MSVPGPREPSVLTLVFDVVDDRPDWPVVRILVDGADPFERVAPGWHGFDPGDVLGDASPLLPVDEGRRVAVYRCTCGVAGCGVIAPVVVPSPDGRRVSWVDFRDYTGVFTGPLRRTDSPVEGSPWNLPDLHFDRSQYLAEIERASSDWSWETPRRRTARLLHERLAPAALVLPPDLTLEWVSPAWRGEGVVLSFTHLDRGPTPAFRQQLLTLSSAHEDPVRASEDMAGRLLAVQPEDWVHEFGHSL